MSILQSLIRYFHPPSTSNFSFANHPQHINIAGSSLTCFYPTFYFRTWLWTLLKLTTGLNLTSALAFTTLSSSIWIPTLKTKMECQKSFGYPSTTLNTTSVCVNYVPTRLATWASLWVLWLVLLKWDLSCSRVHSAAFSACLLSGMLNSSSSTLRQLSAPPPTAATSTFYIKPCIIIIYLDLLFSIWAFKIPTIYTIDTNELYSTFKPLFLLLLLQK